LDSIGVHSSPQTQRWRRFGALSMVRRGKAFNAIVDATLLWSTPMPKL
jgi:hypothetical protein